jgi:hypothetical protein
VSLNVTVSSLLFLIALQGSTLDPHRGAYTRGLGRDCGLCHRDAPRADDVKDAAKVMARMVDGLNKGPLRATAGVTCFSCHRGGPRGAIHPMVADRQAVQAASTNWPAGAPGSVELRREMALYTVSLGVDCGYCHTASAWKDDGKSVMRTARAMATLMKEFPKYFNFARASAFTCYTCHQGAVKVAR